MYVRNVFLCAFSYAFDAGTNNAVAILLSTSHILRDQLQWPLQLYLWYYSTCAGPRVHLRTKIANQIHMDKYINKFFVTTRSTMYTQVTDEFCKWPL